MDAEQKTPQRVIRKAEETGLVLLLGFGVNEHTGKFQVIADEVLLARLADVELRRQLTVQLADAVSRMTRGEE
jgi:hypothetical protein